MNNLTFVVPIYVCVTHEVFGVGIIKYTRMGKVGKYR